MPLLGIYLERTIIREDTYTPVVTAALLTTARAWKQPRCPSVEEWVRRCGAQLQWDLSAIKKGKTVPFTATWVDLEIVTLSEGRQTLKGNSMCYLLQKTENQSVWDCPS